MTNFIQFIAAFLLRWYANGIICSLCPPCSTAWSPIQINWHIELKNKKKTLGILPSHVNNLFFFRSKMVFLNLYFFHYKWCLDSCLWTSPSMFEGEVFKEHPPGNIIKHFLKNTIETSLLSWILHFWKLYNKLPDFSVVIIYQPAKCKLKYS